MQSAVNTRTTWHGLESPCLQFGDSTKVACAFERMKAGRKFDPLHTLESVATAEPCPSLQGQIDDLPPGLDIRATLVAAAAEDLIAFILNA